MMLFVRGVNRGTDDRGRENPGLTGQKRLDLGKGAGNFLGLDLDS